MAEIRLQDVIERNQISTDEIGSYILFRTIEDWCHENIPKERWRFDYGATLCAHGVDIPGRIIFRNTKDLVAFGLRFGC